MSVLRCLGVAAAVTVGASQAFAEIKLEIPPVNLPNTSIISFEAIPDAQPLHPEQITEGATAESQNHRFRIRVPLRTIPWSDGCRCFGYVVLVQRLGPAGDSRVFDVRVKPRGRFNEQLSDVAFRITDGTIVESGSIQLPVASYTPETPAVILAGSARRSIHLSGQQVVEVRIKNTSDLFPVTALIDVDHSAVDLAAEELFQGSAAMQGGDRLVLKPGEVRPVRIALTPQTLNAIARSLQPGGPDAAHADMLVKFDYRVGPFDGDRVLLFSNGIELRFEPTFLSLGLALLLGALLGVGIRTMSQRDSVAAFAKAACAAFLTGIAVDVAAMLMASGGSKLVLFNYGIDPSQLLPTAAIGIACGLYGYRSVDWLMQWFKPKDALQPAPAGVDQ